MAHVGAAGGQHAVILDLKMRAVELALLLIGAVDGLGDGDVARLHLVAVHLEGAEQILVMGAGVTLLADDGDQAVVGAAIMVGVDILDRLDLGGVRRNLDLVALGAAEVGDGVVAETIDPVIVHGAVLAGDAHPVYGAVGIDVLGDDLVLGVDHALEAEGVGAAAAGHGVVLGREGSGLGGEDLRLAVLCRHHLAGVGARQQRVVAAAPIHLVGAEAPDQKVVAGAAGEIVIA